MIALGSNDLINNCTPRYKETVNKWQSLDLFAMQWKQSQFEAEVSSKKQHLQGCLFQYKKQSNSKCVSGHAATGIKAC